MIKRFLAALLVLVMLAPFALTSSAFAAQTLRRGARGSAVMTLQTALKDLGYYTKAVDGIYGSGARVPGRVRAQGGRDRRAEDHGETE